MEDKEMPRMHKYGESKTNGIMTAAVHHVTFSSGLRKILGRLNFVEERVHNNTFNVLSITWPTPVTQ
jgi:hypothetical protein